MCLGARAGISMRRRREGEKEREREESGFTRTQKPGSLYTVLHTYGTTCRLVFGWDFRTCVGLLSAGGGNGGIE